MRSTWQELWSLGTGRSRTYCTMSTTEDGIALDVFHGDTCLEAAYFDTADAAVSAAAVLRFRYSGDRARRVATAVEHETARDITTLMTAQMPACGARPMRAAAAHARTR